VEEHRSSDYQDHGADEENARVRMMMVVVVMMIVILVVVVMIKGGDGGCGGSR
jgi:CHASE3 domain sensor protein